MSGLPPAPVCGLCRAPLPPGPARCPRCADRAPSDHYHLLRPGARLPAGQLEESRLRPRVLIFHASPRDAPLLRLDKEERAFDQLLHQLHLPPTMCRRLHAASVDDLVQALREVPYDLVQFAGHGSRAGIYLEANHSDGGVTLSARQVSALLREHCPNLSAALFVSCYSAANLAELAPAASRVITMSGAAGDEAAIEFTIGFYEEYLRTGSVERGFRSGLMRVRLKDLGRRIKPVIARRPEYGNQQRLLVEAFVDHGRDPLLIDLTPVSADLNRAGEDVDSFLSLVVQKIRIHRWIFEHPSERTVLPIGDMVGIMSWQDARDVVRCDRLLRLRPDLSEDDARIWAGLVVTYNDLFMSPYRNNNRGVEPQDERRFEMTINEFFKAKANYFDRADNAARLRALVADQTKLAAALFASHLEQADSKFHNGDARWAAIHLEAALSSLHDLVDAATVAVTLKAR
jgi:hypothetical protein